MNISEELDRAFGEGPPLPPLEDLLPPGRRALTRRRTAAGAVAAAVVALVIGGAVVGNAVLGGDPSSNGPAVGPSRLTDDAASPTTARSEPPTRAEIQRVLSRSPVEYDGNGRLVIASQAHVLQRLDNPFGVAAPSTSVGISAEIDGATYWFAYVFNPDGSSNGVSTYSADSRKDFETWVADAAGIAEQSDDEWPGIPGLDLVRFAEGDRLEPVEGATLVRQVARPDLGPAWAGPEARSAAAEVLLGGERYYVLARAFDDKPQFIAVPEADGGATLEEFLALAQDRYAEGGGGLL